MTQKTSLNQQEVDNFSKDSALWWDVDGPFAPLHKLNPTRMAYIKGQIQAHFVDKPLSDTLKTPLKGLKAIDIGCGGGLVSESLARMGAKTTGLDADPNAIITAKAHAQESGLNIDYHNMTSEDFLAKQSKSFDVVCALEIIEHVDNPDFFVETALKLLKPDGILILSTLNRTIKSAIFGIFAAEYVFNLVPKGTHSHEKFIKPSELARMLRQYGAQHSDISGLVYDLKTDSFALSSTDLSVNYFMCAVK